MKNYTNELLGLSRTDLQKVWESCWDELQKLNPIRDTEKLVELNRKFDKCVESYFAVDHGDYWMVNVKKRNIKVMKGSKMEERI